MALAVLVPAYNESSFITRCLEGLSAQSYPRLEVLVVDDSSTDDTVQKVSDFTRAHPSMKLRTIRHEKVGGYDIMGNYTDLLTYGWSKLSSVPDYLAICDADTILHPGYYERVVSLMENHSRIGIAGGELLPMPGTAYWWRKKKLLGVFPYVYGANRVYRKRCWQELLQNHDPMNLLAYVGIDSYHALLARALGWEVVKQPDALSTAMRPPASLVSSRLKGIGSFVVGYSLPQITGRALLNRDPGYLRGWLWAHSQSLPRLAKIQPLIQEQFRRRLLHAFLGL